MLMLNKFRLLLLQLSNEAALNYSTALAVQLQEFIYKWNLLKVGEIIDAKVFLGLNIVMKNCLSLRTNIVS